MNNSELKLDKETLPTVTFADYSISKRKWADVTITAPIKQREDGEIFCCDEFETHPQTFYDYWCECRAGESMWIDSKLEDWAKKQYGDSATWEWESPGSLVLTFM